MLNPSDLVLRAELGTERVETNPDDDQPGYSPPAGAAYSWEDGTGHRNFVPVLVESIAAGGVSRNRLEYQPDFFIVTVPNVANVNVEVTLGEDYANFPDARLGPGGYCRIPGRGRAITLRNVGSAAVTPVVLAAQGWGPMAAGDFLVCPGIGTVTL